VPSPRSLPRGIFAVIRATDAAQAITVARGLADTDVAAIEVTLTVPDAVDVIEQLVADGVGRVGAGTVRSVAQVEACAQAGAEFIVSPHLDPLVVNAALAAGLAVVPGTLTPSEIVAAFALGASAAKVFPMQAVGGLSYLKAVSEPLPDIPLVASGGITPSEVPAYFEAGAYGVCLGDVLWRWSDAAQGDVDAIRAVATEVLRAIGSIG
jgi:2-dehydro-3-deoxyphosphogluconate aldolase/(4S)-4-hydroxy-2-oxoglutarate aldolase